MPDLRAQLQTALGAAYAIERELGGGGMSRVFTATETALGRTVVVKVIAPELAEGVSAERFAREMKLAARLQQANIVPVLAAGVADGLPYFTMPYVRGESLRALLTLGPPMPVVDAVGILRDVARALAYAHAEGIVHRDIKPENILLSGDTAVVTDFGIAKALASARPHDTSGATGTLTQVGTSIGTPLYMAPEQAAGDPSTDHRADIYAWGLVAWELLAGAHPFGARATPQALLAAHLSEVPAPVGTLRAGVPPVLSALIARALEKDPARRPASARELLEALDKVTTPRADTISSLRPIAPGSPTRRYAVWAAIGVLVLAGLALLRGRVMPGRDAATAAAPASAQKSLAVLPFESVGGDTANVYFAEGMADEITTELAKAGGLRVAATTSSFTYRNKTADVRDVGKALNVGMVLQGRVQRAGGRIRVSTQLTNAADGLVVWSNLYERELKDVFAVQDAMARDIVAALRVTLVSATPGRSARTGQGTNDVDAYDLYLRGLYFLQQRGPSVARSIPYFQQAIARDSGFAKAWAQLGLAYAVTPLFAFVPADSVLGPARRALSRALALDSLNVDAYAGLGIVHLQAQEWNESYAAFRHALAIDPDHPFSHRGISGPLAALGRIADAIRASERNIELDPLSPPGYVVIATHLLSANEPGKALRASQRAFELDSMSGTTRIGLALNLFFNGQPVEAHRLALTSRPTPQSAGWKGFVLGVTGDTAAAHAYLRTIDTEQRHSSVLHATRALTYLGLRDTSRALEELEAAARARETIWGPDPLGLPVYNAIRHTPRFAAVVRAFGLKPEHFGAGAGAPAR